MIDGSGARGVRADVAIDGNRIAAIAPRAIIIVMYVLALRVIDSSLIASAPKLRKLTAHLLPKALR